MRLWHTRMKLEMEVLLLAESKEEADVLVRQSSFDHLLDQRLQVVGLKVVEEPEKLVSQGWAPEHLVEHAIKGEDKIKLLQAVRIAVDSAEADARKAFNDAELLRLQIPLFPSEP